MKILLMLTAVMLVAGSGLRAENTNATPVPPITYKLTTCAISNEKIGTDGMEPYTFIYKNHEVKLCCKSCKKKFDKDPEKYMARILAADKDAEKTGTKK